MTPSAAHGYAMPAEWTRHARCWMAWPCWKALGPSRLAAARRAFEAAGVEILEAGPAYSEERDFHQERFFVLDPGGNRLELLEPRRSYASEH